MVPLVLLQVVAAVVALGQYLTLEAMGKLLGQPLAKVKGAWRWVTTGALALGQVGWMLGEQRHQGPLGVAL